MAQEDNRPKKTVEASLTESTHVLKYSDINGAGRLFGGRLMEWIDETAGYVAKRHCETDVTTACVDNLQFRRGASIGDMVVNVGRITWVGHTSMEIRVDSYVEEYGGMRYPINHAYVIYVAVDDQFKPIPVKYGLEIRTVQEKAEWQGALLRREARNRRRHEGY